MTAKELIEAQILGIELEKGFTRDDIIYVDCGLKLYEALAKEVPAARNTIMATLALAEDIFAFEDRELAENQLRVFTSDGEETVVDIEHLN